MGNTWNIPDWRKREDYPDHETFPLQLWRWEFLRRDLTYREDYKCRPQGRTADRNALEEIACKYGMYMLVDPRCSAAGLNRGVFVEDEIYFTEIGFQAARAKWLENAIGAVVPRVPGEARRGRANSMHSFIVRAEARGRVLASLDLSQPLEPQFLEIKKELKMKEEEKKEEEEKVKVRARARVNQYELALRLLDARSKEEPEDWTEIKRVISKEQHRGAFTCANLQRKHRDALKLQQKFLRPYYQG